jgi:hypothetical protein
MRFLLAVKEGSIQPIFSKQFEKNNNGPAFNRAGKL